MVNAVYLDGVYLFYLCQIKPSPECSSLSGLPLVEPETTCVLQDSMHVILLILVIILHNYKDNLKSQHWIIKQLLLPWYSGWDPVFVSSTGSLAVFPSDVVSINVASIVVIWAAESRRQFIDVAWIPSLPLRMSFKNIIPITWKFLIFYSSLSVMKYSAISYIVLFTISICSRNRSSTPLFPCQINPTWWLRIGRLHTKHFIGGMIAFL